MRFPKAGMGRPSDYLVATGPAPPSRATRLGVTLRGGDTRVTAVANGSPAEQAGLRAGDDLLAVGDRKIADPVDIRLALGPLAPGDRVRIRWRRDGVEAEGTAELAPPPSPFAPQPAPAK